MEILRELTVIFTLSIVVVFISIKLKIPAVVGLLLTGTIAGPHAFALISNLKVVETMSEIGIVFLLFSIGLEFSIKDLWRLKKASLLGGSLQVSFTIGIVALITILIGRGWREAVLIGFLVALSSTAIVLKLLQEKAEVESPHGSTIIGIELFQDMASILMMVSLPLLAGEKENTASLVRILAESIGIILGVGAIGTWVLPFFLFQIVKTRDKALFIISIIFICLGISLATATTGLSLGLGAFLAGLILSESDYTADILGIILPFKEICMSIFFIAIGMLLNIDFLFRNLTVIILITTVVIILKSLIAGGVTLLLKYPPKTAILVGFGLAQISEFSFVIAQHSASQKLLSEKDYQIFLAVAVITMAVTPSLMYLAPKLAKWLHQNGNSNGTKNGKIQIENHLLIVGFGLCGRTIAERAKQFSFPYLVVEMNNETVQKEGKKRLPIYFGDATEETVLEKFQIKTAKMLVIAISDQNAVKRIVQLAFALNPQLRIFARVRFNGQALDLMALNISQLSVVSDEECATERMSKTVFAQVFPISS